MIAIRGLSKFYADKEAVIDLDLDIADGEIYGFLGPNGAGKTTTIRMLAGLVKPTAGSIEIAGMDVARRPAEVRARLGYIPDRPYVYDKLTGFEFLRFVGELYGLAPETVAVEGERWLRRFSLHEDAHRFTESYSHGMRQKLVFAATLLHEPELLVIDEPMVGLDPRSARLIKDILREKAAAGMTIFLSTHTLSVAEELCTRIGIIHKGRIVAQGSAADLLALASGRHGTAGADLESVFLRLTEESGEGPADGPRT